jgi:YVTN family beta-propeller protein
LYLSVSFVSGVVNNGGEYFSPGEILVLDTSTFKYTAAISIPAGMGTMALTPDGSTLVYTTNFGRVQLLSTGKYALLGTVHLAPANGLLDGLALSPDGSTAYVTDGVNNLLLVVNLTTQTQLASIPIGSNPSPVAISPDGSEAWVATVSGLEVVNIATGQVTSVSLPGEPSAIVFGPD